MMNKLLLLLLSLCCSVSFVGAEPLTEKVILQASSGIPLPQDKEHAKLMVYLVKSDKPAPLFLVCPGGGYSALAIGKEGHDVAKWLNEQGISAAILQYRMPKGRHAVPLADAEGAMKMIRSRAGQWNIDPRQVGVMGFSAGGHLAASLSTLAAPGNRPNFAVLFYPVISFTDELVHKGSRSSLLGDKVDDAVLRARYCTDRKVDQLTPPTMLFLSDNDSVVVPENSALYYLALKANKRPASMHIYPGGGHGWGFLPRPNFPYLDEVKSLILDWLQTQKIIPPSTSAT